MPNPDDPVSAPADQQPKGAATVVAGRRNGHRGTRPLPAVPGTARPPGPSTHLALIVLGIMAALFVLGTVAAGLTSSPTRPSPAPTAVATAPGAGQPAVPARALLSPIVSAGQPPTDLLDAVAVPEGARPDTSSATSQGLGLYDHSLRFESAASEAQLIDFFRAQLPFEHWRLLSQGPARNTPGYLVVGQHPASDGHEWEIGVTVSPTGFSGSTQTTTFTLRLFAVSDLS